MKEMLILLTVHFVADFVLQTDWQAKNKSKSFDALARHVGVYTASFVPVALYLFGPTREAFGFVVFTFWLHFWTDAITSRINSGLWEEQRVHAFFVGIGADQLSHAYALALTYWAMSR